MLPAGDLRDWDTLGTGFCIHVALVIISHAIRCAREVGLPLAAVSALTNRLAIPDVTLGALLSAHELVTGCTPRHSNGTLAALYVNIASRHTALVTTDVGAAFLKSLAVLKFRKEQAQNIVFNLKLNKTRKQKTVCWNSKLYCDCFQS